MYYAIECFHFNVVGVHKSVWFFCLFAAFLTVDSAALFERKKEIATADFCCCSRVATGAIQKLQVYVDLNVWIKENSYLTSCVPLSPDHRSSL